MANLKDLVKQALAKKNNTVTDDGHESATHSESDAKPKAKPTKTVTKKPPTRTTGRGR